MKKNWWLVRWLEFSVLCAAAISGGSAKTFFIAGLFPSNIADPQDRIRLGVYPELAARLAAQQVNEGGLLSAHNVSLELLSFGTGCDQDTTNIAYLKLLGKVRGEFESGTGLPPHLSPPYVVLGPACNQPAYFTAALTSRYLKDIQISYSATTPLLSDVERFPLFYRTVPSYSDYAQTVFAIMRHFDWLLVGVVHQVVSHFTRSLEELNSFLAAVGRSQPDGETTDQPRVILSLPLNSLLTDRENELNGARVFIAMVPEKLAAMTLCAAYRKGLTGKKYQWILLGDYLEGWWLQLPTRTRTGEGEKTVNLACSSDEMLQAVESALILTHSPSPPSSSSFYSSSQGMPFPQSQDNADPPEFWEAFAATVQATTGEAFQPELATSVGPAYDAVWIVAHALESTLSRRYLDEVLEDSQRFSNAGKPVSNFTRKLNMALERTDYHGVSGRIRFDSSSHSKQQPLTHISQMQSGHMIPIGRHDQSEGGTGLNLTLFGNNLCWQGPLPPRDRPAVETLHVELWLINVLTALALVGVLAVMAVLVTNWIYRRHKVIKASSPYLNLVMLLGCAMRFVAIPSLTVQSSSLPLSVPVLEFSCTTAIWLFNLSFTLVMGTLFAKTWRVYYVFRNPWTQKRPYKDSVLLGMVGVLVLYDLTVLLLWVSLDRLFLVEGSVVDFETFVEKRVNYCTSQFTPGDNTSYLIWNGVTVFPKFLLLAFGAFLVFETNKINSKYFRDAKFVGASILATLVTVSIWTVMTLFAGFSTNPQLSFLLVGGAQMVTVYTILVMNFMPKFVLLRRYKRRVPSTILKQINPSYRTSSMTRKTKESDIHSAASASTEEPSTPSSRDEATLTSSDSWEDAYDDGSEVVPVKESLKYAYRLRGAKSRLTFDPVLSRLPQSMPKEELATCELSYPYEPYCTN